ncbi:MAG TPA: hypothetical protein VJ991_05030 [Balneolales bacterium]|nr:hypothetical protein [Balneolales bacterium]
MRKYLKLLRTLLLLLGLYVLVLLTACNSRTKLSDKTLTLDVKRDGNALEYVNHEVTKQPFYEYDSNAPLYKAIIYNKKGGKLGTFLFGKVFFINRGTVHQLTFPYYANMNRIVIYKLDSSSGHITNKNKQVALNWVISGN